MSAFCTPLSPHSQAAGRWGTLQVHLPCRVQAGRFSRRAYERAVLHPEHTRFGLGVIYKC